MAIDSCSVPEINLNLKFSSEGSSGRGVVGDGKAEIAHFLDKMAFCYFAAQNA